MTVETSLVFCVKMYLCVWRRCLSHVERLFATISYQFHVQSPKHDTHFGNKSKMTFFLSSGWVLGMKRLYSREDENQFAKPIVTLEYAHNALGPLKPSIVPWMETRRGKGKMGRTHRFGKCRRLLSSVIASHPARSQG